MHTTHISSTHAERIGVGVRARRIAAPQIAVAVCAFARRDARLRTSNDGDDALVNVVHGARLGTTTSPHSRRRHTDTQEHTHNTGKSVKPVDAPEHKHYSRPGFVGCNFAERRFVSVRVVCGGCLYVCVCVCECVIPCRCRCGLRFAQ